MIPLAGPFVRTIAGMIFDIAIASDAARVTRIRSRMYVWFVAGYVHQLALADTGAPKLDTSHGKLGRDGSSGTKSISTWVSRRHLRRVATAASLCKLR